MSVCCQSVCFVVTLYRTYMYEWSTVKFFCKCYIFITQWCILLSNRFMYMFMHATWLRILIFGSWFLQGHAWYTRLRRRRFGGCVLPKFWGESYVKPFSLWPHVQTLSDHWLEHLRNKISFFEVHWDMNCSWSRDQIL